MSKWQRGAGADFAGNKTSHRWPKAVLNIDYFLYSPGFNSLRDDQAVLFTKALRASWMRTEHEKPALAYAGRTTMPSSLSRLLRSRSSLRTKDQRHGHKPQLHFQSCRSLFKGVRVTLMVRLLIGPHQQEAACSIGEPVSPPIHACSFLIRRPPQRLLSCLPSI